MAALKLVSEGKNYAIYKDERDNEVIRIDNVRFSHPYIGTPGESENDAGVKEKKWRLQAMLPKETHLDAKNAVKALIEKLMKAADVKVPLERWFLSNGDAKADEDSKYESLRGHWLISASDGRIRPAARDRKGNLIMEIEKIDEVFYGGMWGNVLIRPWYFDGKSKKDPKKTLPKRIVAGLTAVQFVKDDKPFGSGRIDDTDVWKAVEGDDDDGMGGSGDSDDDI